MGIEEGGTAWPPPGETKASGETKGLRLYMAGVNRRLRVGVSCLCYAGW